MQITPYEREQIVLGHALRFPEQTRSVLSELTHDKFIYDSQGRFDTGHFDHADIWQAIQVCVMEHRAVNVTNVVDSLSPTVKTELRQYVRTLEDKMTPYWGILEFDPESFKRSVQLVDRTGVVFRTALQSRQMGSILDDPESFVEAVGAVDDPVVFINNYVRELRDGLRVEEAGYKSLGAIAEAGLERLGDIESGKQLSMLPSYFRPFQRAGLFPVRSLATVHGMSGGGKSALVHSINLGTAIGLYTNGIKGCVAVNSMEMEDIDLLFRSASMLAGFNLMNLRQSPDTFVKTNEYRRFKDWIEHLSVLPMYVDDTNLAETGAIEYRLDSMHTSDKGPVWQMSADYMELHGDKRPYGASKEEWLDRLIHNYQSLSRYLGASIIVISQSSFGGETGNNRYKIAGAGGTRYSQSLRHASDIVLEFWNPIYMRAAGIDFEIPDGMDGYNAWALVQKYRGGMAGVNIRVGWEPQFTRIYEPLDGDTMYQGGTTIFSNLVEFAEQVGGELDPVLVEGHVDSDEVVVQPQDTINGQAVLGF
ncbi:MAG TPA: DnaB-like helicase C-terminal domain-containing protein [Bellilinea sp.]|nr:DnaB-like helicase C-terminal domain-containing protein [Bellilinea sp.]